MADTPAQARRRRRTPAQDRQEATLTPSQKSIRGKRRAASQKAIKAKVANGTYDGTERALVRVGAANTAVLVGADDLSDWSMEELKAGKRNDINGGNRGVNPVIVPKKIHDELVRRTLDEAAKKLRENLDVAVSALTEIVADKTVDAKDRLKASQMIIDRVMGKNPETIKVSGDAKWEQALQAGIVPMTPESLGANTADEEDPDINDVED